MLPIIETGLRLCSAVTLGGLVGWDRQRKEGAAGLRTHMLVCLGACLAMLVSMYGFDDVVGRPGIALDPSRVAAQVISGIGFLGAGTIFFLRQQVVKGLTTAAGLWSVAAVGLAIGGGMYVAAFLTTAIMLIVLAVIKPLEKRLFKISQLKTILLTVDLKQIALQEIEAIVRNKGLFVAQMLLHSEDNDLYQMKLTLDAQVNKTAVLSVIEQLNSTPGISNINLRL